MNEVMKRWRFLYAPDLDGGSNGNSDAEEEGDEAAGTSAFQRALEGRNNDGTALARSLWDDNYKLRRKNARLTKANQDLTTTTRSDGSKVLSKEEAAEYEAYKALNLKPEAVQTAIQERDTYKGRVDSLAREKTVRDAAIVAGYDPDVLLERDTFETKVSGKTLAYEVKEVETEGQKGKVVFIKDGDNEQPLTEYAQSNWAKHLPSLTATVNQSANSQQPTQATGTPFPSQHQGGGGQRPASVKAQTQQTLNQRYKESPAKT